jgi:hypothetical protein
VWPSENPAQCPFSLQGCMQASCRSRDQCVLCLQQSLVLEPNRLLYGDVKEQSLEVSPEVFWEGGIRSRKADSGGGHFPSLQPEPAHPVSHATA